MGIWIPITALAYLGTNGSASLSWLLHISRTAVNLDHRVVRKALDRGMAARCGSKGKRHRTWNWPSGCV